MRCLGGPLDNVDVPDNGISFSILDPEVPIILRTGKRSDGTPVDIDEPIKSHTYEKKNTFYVHKYDCCPIITYKDWCFAQTGVRL